MRRALPRGPAFAGKWRQNFEGRYPDLRTSYHTLADSHLRYRVLFDGIFSPVETTLGYYQPPLRGFNFFSLEQGGGAPPALP